MDTITAVHAEVGGQASIKGRESIGIAGILACVAVVDVRSGCDIRLVFHLVELELPFQRWLALGQHALRPQHEQLLSIIAVQVLK